MGTPAPVCSRHDLSGTGDRPSTSLSGMKWLFAAGAAGRVCRRQPRRGPGCDHGGDRSLGALICNHLRTAPRSPATCCPGIGPSVALSRAVLLFAAPGIALLFTPPGAVVLFTPPGAVPPCMSPSAGRGGEQCLAPCVVHVQPGPRRPPRRCCACRGGDRLAGSGGTAADEADGQPAGEPDLRVDGCAR